MHFWIGKISGFVFWKGSLKDYKLTYRLPTAIFFYALIGPFPVAIVLFFTVQAFTIINMALLVALMAFSIYSALTWRIDHKPQHS